ncbi:nitrous oxide-stimulated promoter family protein [Sulfurimonas sp.]|nr:nitrous oxide-stimulated promoter family protein [Sulfurimonas sp.]
MSEDKFIHDSKTLLKFIQYYCEHKHENESKVHDTLKLSYENNSLDVTLEYSLCKECEKTLSYSYTKLQVCPHEVKPSCRKCDDPCYDKKEWKLLAKIMKYSGMRFGLLKIKKLFKLTGKNND